MDKPLHVSAGLLAQNHRETSVTEGGASSGFYAQICQREHFSPSIGEEQQSATDYCLGLSRFEEKNDGREGLFNPVEQTRVLLQFARNESGQWLFNEKTNYIGFGESNDYDHLILGKDLISGGAVWHFTEGSGPGISGRLFLSQFVANNLDPMGDQAIPLLSLKLGIDLRLVWGPELKEKIPEATTGFDVAYLMAMLGHTLLQNYMTSQALTSPAAELADGTGELFGEAGVASPELEDTSLLQGFSLVGGAMQQNTLLAAGQKASPDQQTLLRLGEIGAGVGYLLLSEGDAGNSMLTQGVATLMNVVGDFSDAALKTRLLLGAASFVAGGLLADGEPNIGLTLLQAGFQNGLAAVIQPELDATLGNHHRSGFGLIRVNEDGSRQIGGGTRTRFENGLFTEWSLLAQNVPVSDNADPIFDELTNRNPLIEGAKVSVIAALGGTTESDTLRFSGALRGALHYGVGPVPVPAIGVQGDITLKLFDLPIRVGIQAFGEYYGSDIHTGWGPVVSVGN